VDRHRDAAHAMGLMALYQQLRLAEGAPQLAADGDVGSAPAAAGTHVPLPVTPAPGISSDQLPDGVVWLPARLPLPLLQVEVAYNMARAAQVVGQTHVAAALYRAALQVPVTACAATLAAGTASGGSKLTGDELASALNLQAEAAFNYASLLAAAGSTAEAHAVVRAHLRWDR